MSETIKKRISNKPKKTINLLKTHNVNRIWVKGHAGHPENEKCRSVSFGHK